jgi:acyl-coenzyme A thioesterase PaaI-like protein
MRHALAIAVLVLTPALAVAQGNARTPNLNMKYGNQAYENDNWSRIDESLGAMTAGPPYDPTNNGKVYDRGGSEVNVKNAIFGATGDGVTDDTTSIQKAADVACAGAKQLRFPSGTYIIRASGGEGVEIRCDDLTIVGDNGAILYWDTEDTSVTGMLWANGKSGIRIDNLTLKQDNTTAAFVSTYQQNAGILFENSDDNIVMRVTCEDMYGNGCVKFAPGATATDGSDRNIVRDSVFRRCSVYGAVVTSGADNKFLNSTYEDCRVGSETNSTSNAVPGTLVIGNTIYAVLKTGDATERVGIEISGRDSDDFGQQAAHNRLIANAHIFVSGAPDTLLLDNIVTGQSSADASRSPIYISTSDRTQVCGGMLDGTVFAASKTAGRGLLSIVTSNDVTVGCGLIVKNSLNGHGIGMREALRAMIRDVKVTGNTGTGIYVYLDSDYTTIDGAEIIDNNPSNGGSDFGIRVDGDSNNTMTGVTIKNTTVISPASDKQGVPIRLEDGTYRLANNTLAPRQNTASVTTSGTVAITTSSELGAVPTAQTIAAGNTITADACGGVKLVTAAGAVTTSTTNTFTAPAGINTGCAMDVCNTSGANAITLDANTNFITASAADVVLGVNDCVRVTSDGAVWRQVTALLDNGTTTTTSTTTTSSTSTSTTST